jgi:multidrug resistance efflux pump
MRPKAGSRSLSLFLRALFFAALVSSGSLAAQAQNSTPISTPPDGLWLALLEQTQSLPQVFDDFEMSLNAQLELLRLNNLSLQRNNLSLANSNASLTESLKQSKAEAATSARKSEQLQKDLDASTTSISRAKIEAAALELKAARWKIVGYGGLAVGFAGLVYGLTR